MACTTDHHRRRTDRPPGATSEGDIMAAHTRVYAIQRHDICLIVRFLVACSLARVIRALVIMYRRVYRYIQWQLKFSECSTRALTSSARAVAKPLYDYDADSMHAGAYTYPSTHLTQASWRSCDINPSRRFFFSSIRSNG